VDAVVETWRVLEDPREPLKVQALPPVAAAPSAGSRLWLVLGAVLILVIAAAVWLLASAPSGGALTVNAAHQGQGIGRDLASALVADPSATAESPSPEQLVVEVNGAVRKPGVYRFGPGARVADAITAAGGFGARVNAAAAQQLNLAERLTDGQQVHVPAREETTVDPAAATSSGGSSIAGNASETGPVNLNTATSAQLDTLPGIGPATAAKIIAARATRPFRTVQELRDRKVVGQATFEKIQSLVSVD
jgi:competence protein ComEA